MDANSMTTAASLLVVVAVLGLETAAQALALAGLLVLAALVLLGVLVVRRAVEAAAQERAQARADRAARRAALVRVLEAQEGVKAMAAAPATVAEKVMAVVRATVA